VRPHYDFGSDDFGARCPQATPHNTNDVVNIAGALNSRSMTVATRLRTIFEKIYAANRTKPPSTPPKLQTVSEDRPKIDKFILSLRAAMV